MFTFRGISEASPVLPTWVQLFLLAAGGCFVVTAAAVLLALRGLARHLSEEVFGLPLGYLASAGGASVSTCSADRITHHVHPEREREAWCGTPLIGVIRQGRASCVVCADLRRAWRRGRYRFDRLT
jgi:hypothetical protein